MDWIHWVGHLAASVLRILESLYKFQPLTYPHTKVFQTIQNSD